jgi:hypothetical protein
VPGDASRFDRPAQLRGRITPRHAAAVGLLLVTAGAGLALSLLFRSGGSTSGTGAATAVNPIGPIAATPAILVAFSKALNRPIYWAGPMSGDTYELTETSAGNIFVRYLPKGVRVGDPRASFLAIGTYPYPGALKALQTIAKGKGTALQGGGLAVTTAGHPGNFHIAYPGLAYQIEVYDPVPGRAHTLALSGRVKPVR